MPLSMLHASTTAVTEHGPPAWKTDRNGGAWDAARGGPRSAAAGRMTGKDEATEVYNPLLRQDGCAAPFPHGNGGNGNATKNGNGSGSGPGVRTTNGPDTEMDNERSNQ